MTMAQFANSKKGTIAKFMLSTGDNSLKEVSKSLKSACYKKSISCKIDSTTVIVDTGGGVWQNSKILTVINLG